MPAWSDTAFASVGSDYELWVLFGVSPGFAGSGGNMVLDPGYAGGLARRVDDCTTEDQYVKVTYTSNTDDGELFLATHQPDITPVAPERGVWLKLNSSAVNWLIFINGSYRGNLPAVSTSPSGPGSYEMRVVAGVITLYYNDSLVSTSIDYSADGGYLAVAGNTRQGFGGNGSSSMVVSEAEGGDYTASEPPAFDGSYIRIGSTKYRLRDAAGNKLSLRDASGNRWEI